MQNLSFNTKNVYQAQTRMLCTGRHIQNCQNPMAKYLWGHNISKTQTRL